MQMMSQSKPTHELLFFLLIFFIIASLKLSYCMGNTTIFCPKIEKHSLLSFKQSLKDDYNQLTSWDGEVNCCKWEGVLCNNFTGHVHELHLRGPNFDPFLFHPFLFPYQVEGLSGKINKSLLNLKHLRLLDLSQNNFTGETIPSFIGLLTNLEYLNLSFAGFHGKIPHNIGNLSNLHTLDLEGNGLYVDRLEWLSGLSQLEYLNMNGANLREATNWAQVINSNPSLVELHFEGCTLDFIAPPVDVNMTSLTLLDLSHNYFDSFAIPRWIFQLSNLVILDLSGNLFEGPIPTISNATKLQHIDLSVNSFNSSIPDWLYFCKDLEFVSLSENLLQGTISNAIANLTSLSILHLGSNQLSGKIPKEIVSLCKINSLDLSYNELEGEISESFGNMSECFLRALQDLLLGFNKLSGHLTDQFGEFKSLQFLDLGINTLSGTIPINLGKLSSLRYLYLDGNKFTGNLPESLGQLFNLEYLYINDNMLEGDVTESHFANLTNLDTFSASGNHLTLKVSPNWIPPFQLRGLGLSSWNFGEGSQIPSWLETQKNLSHLDLSNTGISGNIPSWLWGELSFLNLSHNHLHGQIPYIRGPGYVYLSANQFNGSLPRIADTLKELDLSNNSFSGSISHFLCDRAYETYDLWILHLGGNQLNGELPDCWVKWPLMLYLNLGNNNMSGSIPNSIGFLANLVSLNLYGNKFFGQIPFLMHNCTELTKIDLADNDLDGNIPTWMGTSIVNLKFLILRSNKLNGTIPSEICHLNFLQILDLSNNKFSGIIPRCVCNFTAMATNRSLATERSLATRRSFAGLEFKILIVTTTFTGMGDFLESVSVATKGRELQYDTILQLVTNIDLSKNDLSGDIPKELTSLAGLESLNLSGNHLTGLIPDKIGDMKQLESLDLSNNSLSGQIPSSFTLMSSLSYLNLSSNNLIGKIPESTQILGFDASSFIGNNLCGPPLTSNCSHGGDKVHEQKDENEGEKIEWFYVFLSLGYAVGFSVVCTTLVLKKSWREAYFGLVECMWDKLYVYAYIKWTRLTDPSGPSS